MNSEELEQSLRTEFESYLKSVLAEARQEMSQLQEKIEDEIEKHKTQLDQVFQEAFARVNSDKEFDAGFKESVVEHLRLARDEGARITATAIAEAEEMEKQNAFSAAPKVGFAELREAINDISSKTSQSEILKSLVNHAGNFAPRGAFFIVKNEHFVGWRKFGEEKGENEEAIREIFVPVSSDSVLSESVRSLATVESSAETFSADAAVLEKLEFGAPEKMYAIPLIARGRGVAVLYADHGNSGTNPDTDALETMVRVAGLTVELLASVKTPPRARKSAAAAASVAAAEDSRETRENSYEPVESYQAPASAEMYSAESVAAFDSQSAYQPSYQPEPTSPPPFTSEDYSAKESYARDEATVENFDRSAAKEESVYPTYDDSSWNQPAKTDESDYSQDYSAEPAAEEASQDFSYQPSAEPAPPVSTNEYQTTSEYQYESAPATESVSSYEIPETDTFQSYAPPVETESYAPVQTEDSYGRVETEKPQSGFGDNFAASVNQPVETNSSARTRFSDRNVDLPIEVTEDERRLHNDARRFARLLVSEIKLYNEQKVREGRESNDLYERLREAIDRSREMYDKRVQPSVAAKFDYFHYELVNSLGEGEQSRLGESYPGATV